MEQKVERLLARRKLERLLAHRTVESFPLAHPQVEHLLAHRTVENLLTILLAVRLEPHSKLKLEQLQPDNGSSQPTNQPVPALDDCCFLGHFPCWFTSF